MTAHREPTAAQQAILAWLASYRAIHITYSRGTRRPVHWSHSWASEAARRDMVDSMRVFGSDESEVDPGGAYPQLGATPRLTKGTFDALRDRGWIRPIARGAGTMVSYWQISTAGLKAIDQEIEGGTR